MILPRINKELIIIIVIPKFANRYIFRSYANREVLANLKTHSNKNVARSHLFNIRFNTTNFRRTTTPHEMF